MTAPGARRRLGGQFELALSPAEAFRLFTARGEQDWVEGWQPRFPSPTDDDTEPGTVFETGADGRRTFWVVVERIPGALIRYARVTPGATAGTVSVELAGSAQGCRVTVTYDLTALTDATSVELEDFASRFQEYLGSWKSSIESWLRASGR